jgi:predicted ester cyclase
MSIEQNKILVRRLYEAFDRGKLNEVAEFVDPQFVANVLGTTDLDWEGFEHFGKAFRSAFPNGKHVFEHVVADEENVVTIGRYEGTQTGPMNDLAPTRLEVGLPVMHLDRVIDGKLVEHRGLANEKDFMRQLGVETES